MKRIDPIAQSVNDCRFKNIPVYLSWYSFIPQNKAHMCGNKTHALEINTNDCIILGNYYGKHDIFDISIHWANPKEKFFVSSI